MSGYDAVMQVAANEDAEFWLSLTRGFHSYVTRHARRDGIAADEVEFSFDWTSRSTISRRLRRSPNEDAAVRLIPLIDAGVLAKAGDSDRDDSGNFYRLPDPDGVGRALDELQVAHP
jgi:hypothetical protein